MMYMAIRALLALLFTGDVLAAALTAAPALNAKAQRAALQFRQASSITYMTILGYYSNGESTSSGTTETIWAPTSITTTPYYYSSTAGDYWNTCVFGTSLISTGTDASSYVLYSTETYTPDCTIYTKCSGGAIYGTADTTTTSIFYQQGNYRCFTYMLFDDFGDTSGGLTSLNYFGSSSGLLDTTIFYRNQPATTGLTSLTSGASPTGTPTPSATPSSPTPTPTTSSSSGGSGGGGGSKNTGAIAGGVVGGIAVLALAGVAVLWILKRHKRHAHTPEQPIAQIQPPYPSQYPHPQSPTPYYPPSQGDKPPGTQAMYDDQQRMSQAPEYVPPTAHSGYGSAWGAGNGGVADGYGRTSPQQGGMLHTHSPQPMYPEGFRGELSGVRSPAP